MHRLTMTQEQQEGETATTNATSSCSGDTSSRIEASATIPGTSMGESDSVNKDNSSKGISSRSNNNLQPLCEEEQQQQEDGTDTAAPRAAQQPLSPPPLAAFMTGASSGSSGSSGGRRRFSAARLRATTSGGSERSPPTVAAGAACLPRDDNLYDSLVRYQADNDDSTTVSMGETLRSVSTWYSVQSDDDRKIPARPQEGTYDGTYREPIRRPYRRAGSSAGTSSNPSNGTSSHESSCSSAVGAAAGVAGAAAGDAAGRSSTPGYPPAAAAGRAGRYPPPAAATRRTSSGSMSRSVASGPPPVVWEQEQEEKDNDDYTAISSLANHTADRSDEGSCLNALPRWPLGGIDESCAVGNNTASNNNNSNSEFACLSAAAQLSQEVNMGNMVETTRSAPTPYAAGANRFNNGSGTDWEHSHMDWAFPSLAQPAENPVEEHHKLPPSRSGSGTSNRGPAAAAPPAATPMNDFTRMQQTLGMQDLCVPGATNSTSTNHSLNESEHSSGSHLRRNRSGRAAPAQSDAPRSISCSQQEAPSAASNSNCGTSCNTEQQPSTSLNSATNNTATTATTSGSDPAAQEQFQIWKQIQEEQERKQMELAMQLSQAATATARSVGPGEYDYPSQNGKNKEGQSGAGVGASGVGATGGQMDEEEALKVALRISQEETHNHGGLALHRHANESGQGQEEDEIALVLRLSKEQAEADRMRFQQMQEAELSEDEQLRLAMEQSMKPRGVSPHHHHEPPSSQMPEGDDEEMRRALAESLQQPDHSDGSDRRGGGASVPGGGDVDEDIALALRLSQVQMEEEERFRQSFLQGGGNEPEGEEDPVMGSESFSQMIQSYPGGTLRRGAAPELGDAEVVPPVRSRPSQEPASPGLAPPGHDPTRHFSRRTFGEMEDLEAMRESFEDQQVKKHLEFPHPAKIHGPDDGCDMPPVSRPQRKGDPGMKQPKSRPSYATPDAHTNHVVDIDRDSRDVLVREGQSETRAAIMQGQSQIVTCRGCFGKLHAPMNCALVFCPTCNTVSQVSNSANVGV